MAILLQYRGLAFQGGGDKGLDEHVTLPSKCQQITNVTLINFLDILRKYNPTIFGYALGVSSSDVWDKAHLVWLYC